MDIDVIVPAVDTTAVAEAPTVFSDDINVTCFPYVSLALEFIFSLLRSNRGLSLSTYIIVDPMLTFLIIFAVGLITGS